MGVVNDNYTQRPYTWSTREGTMPKGGGDGVRLSLPH